MQTNKDNASSSETTSRLNSSTRKSARLKPTTRNKVQTTLKTLPTKGRSRRVIFKKNSVKAPPAIATVVTSDCIFYEGSYWQVGDVVSVVDQEGGGVYYAQLRGFLQDQYCSKSAVITWLVPTRHLEHRDTFDANAYTCGPEEDLPRDMSVFEFVCHAPSNYFGGRSPPPDSAEKPALGYVSSRLGYSEIRSLDSDMTDISMWRSAPPGDSSTVKRTRHTSKTLTVAVTKDKGKSPNNS